MALNKKISQVSMGEVTTHDNNSTNHLEPNVFDTPNTLSPAVSRDNSVSPSKPIQAYSPPPKPRLGVDTDLEKGLLSPVGSARQDAQSPLYSPCREYNVNFPTKECTMWPSKQTLKQKARKEKGSRRARNCYGMTRQWGDLNKKQRTYAKILLVLVILALAIGLGIGISRAVGGGVWASDGHQTTIPKDN